MTLQNSRDSTHWGCNAEVDRLRAELSEERDRSAEGWDRARHAEARLAAVIAERDNWRRSTQELRDEMEQWDFDEEVARMRERAEKAEAALAAATGDAQ